MHTFVSYATDQRDEQCSWAAAAKDFVRIEWSGKRKELLLGLEWKSIGCMMDMISSFSAAGDLYINLAAATMTVLKACPRFFERKRFVVCQKKGRCVREALPGIFEG